MSKKILMNLLKPLLGFAVLGILIWHGGLNPGEAAKALWNRLDLALAGLLTVTFLSFVAGYRWFLLIHGVGIPITFRRIFSLHMIGLFFVTLIPGGTGGDLIKGFYLYRDFPEYKGRALTSIVIDRLVGMFALLAWGLFGLLLNVHLAFTHPVLKWNSFLYTSLFFGFVVFFATFLSPLGQWGTRLIQKWPYWGKSFFQSLSEALLDYRKKPLLLLSAFGLTLVVHGCLLLTFFLMGLALGVDLPLQGHAFVVPVLTMINGLPISPGGLGVGEAAGTYLYNIMGVSEGAEILLLYHFYVLITALMGLPFYLLYKGGVKGEKTKQNEYLA